MLTPGGISGAMEGNLRGAVFFRETAKTAMHPFHIGEYKWPNISLNDYFS